MRYEFKARTVSEILDGTFKLYRDHWQPLLTIAALLSIPTMIFSGFADWLSKAAKAGSVDAAMAPMLGVLVSLPLVILAATVEYCALTSATVDAYLGRPFTVGGAIRRAFSLFFPLLWVGLLFYVAVGFGFLLLVIPGVYLTLIWAVWLQAVVVEDKRGSAALGRSRQLTRGATGRLGWLLLAFLAVQLALVYGIHAAIPAALSDIPFLGAALADVPSVLIAPVYPAVLTLFYFDGRIRHEGWDLEQKVAEGVAPPASAALP